MNAMSCYPEDRATFQGERAAGGNCILQPFGRLVSTVCQQAVICHTDSNIDCQEIQDGGHDKIGPAKKEKSGDRTCMKECHKANGDPIGLALCMFGSASQVLSK